MPLPPLVAVDERLAFVGKGVTGVHRARVPEHHERIAAGVRGTVVVEIDRVLALENSHLVLERAVGKAVLVGFLLEDGHLLHQSTSVFLDDDLHRRRKELVAAGVVAVGVGVDDVGDRLVGDGLHLIEDRLAVVGEFGVNQHDT